MTITVVAVHPSVVVVKSGANQFELPRDTFPGDLQAGQTWKLELTHEPTEDEKIASLNSLLPSA